MRLRRLAPALLCCSLGATSLAQTIDANRIDFGEIKSTRPTSSPYGHVALNIVPVDPSCPEQHGAVEIKAGVLSLHRLEEARSVRLFESPNELKPVGDD